MTQLNFNGQNIDIDTAANRRFGDDPVSFLRSKWVNPRNYNILHGFARWSTASGTPAQVKVAGGGGLGPITNDDLCKVTHFDDGAGTVTALPIARVGLEPDTTVGLADYETRYTLENPHTSFVPIYFLPSRANQISCLRLRSTPLNGRPRIVMTTAVDGCSIFVTCDNPANPLDDANHVRIYHANGVHVAGAIGNRVNYTRRLLRRFVNHRYHHTHPHLALELTSAHYYGTDLTDEQTAKTNKGYAVNATGRSNYAFLVFGYMDGNGVWSFHYQWHGQIDYTRAGATAFFLGQRFQSEKLRLHPLHAPQLADWNGPGLHGIP